MISLEGNMEIKVRYRQGQSLKSHRTRTGHSTNTVRKYIRDGVQPGYGPREPRAWMPSTVQVAAETGNRRPSFSRVFSVDGRMNDVTLAGIQSRHGSYNSGERYIGGGGW